MGRAPLTALLATTDFVILAVVLKSQSYGAVSNRQSSDVINSRFNSYRLHQRVVPVNIARLTDVIGWPVPAGLGPSLSITRIQMD